MPWERRKAQRFLICRCLSVHMCTFMAQKSNANGPNGSKWPKWPNDLSGSDLWVYYQPPKHRKLRSYSMLFWIGISNHSIFLGQLFWVIPTLWPWNITLWHKNKSGWLENPRTKWKCHWSLEKHIYEWVVHCHVWLPERYIGWFIMIFYIITA